MAGFIVVALALLGLGYLVWVISRAVGSFLANTLTTDFKSHTLAALGGFANNGSAWVTTIATVVLAIATYFLWRATRALSRSTNVQFSISGPLLNLILYPDGGYPGFEDDPFANAWYRPYWNQWARDDQADANFAALTAGATPSYINLIVLNRSTNPHGVAAKIAVRATLRFGAPGTSTNHPYSMTRTAFFPACEPNTQVAAQFFNVGGLFNFLVEVDEVEYYDILERKRRCGWGYSIFRQSAAGTMIFPKFFEPRKGEFTDEI